jgi:pSer/pThr/pTyr-binding forkhead associated (FHA) protein
MDIGGKARKLERRLTRTVDAALGELVGRDAPAPLEIVHGVLDRAEHEVQDVGRGRRLFPFTCVRVHVLADPNDADAKARFEAVVAGPPSLAERLIDRLRSAGCRDLRLTTDVVFESRAGSSWDDPRFDVSFERNQEPAAVAPPQTAAEGATEVPRLKLTVVKGTAEQRAYAFNGGRVDIGRRAEVIDQRQRLIRTNQVAFVDEGDDNRTVSRRHAHVEFVAAERAYRVFDDRSAHGTNIVRGGRTIKVPPGVRGVRLEAGDEIALGHARLKVAMEQPGRRG